MRSTYAGVGVVVLLGTASWSVGQTPATDTQPLVGTWQLTGLERAATTGPLARVANPSGIRIQSANGYVIQILTQSARAASLDAAEQFATYQGSWGTCAVDANRSTATCQVHGDLESPPNGPAVDPIVRTKRHAARVDGVVARRSSDNPRDVGADS